METNKIDDVFRASSVGGSDKKHAAGPVARKVPSSNVTSSNGESNAVWFVPPKTLGLLNHDEDMIDDKSFQCFCHLMGAPSSLSNYVG